MRIFSVFLLTVVVLGGMAAVAPAERLTVGLGLQHARLGAFVDEGLDDVTRIEEIFGAPARTVRENDMSCKKRWPRLGLTATFVAFGSSAGAPCRAGQFAEAILTTRRWRTPNGVGPGVSARRAARRSPRRCTGTTCGGLTGYGFAFHRSECSTGRFPGVVAVTAQGRVARMVVWKRWCE